MELILVQVCHNGRKHIPNILELISIMYDLYVDISFEKNKLIKVFYFIFCSSQTTVQDAQLSKQNQKPCRPKRISQVYFHFNHDGIVFIFLRIRPFFFKDYHLIRLGRFSLLLSLFWNFFCFLPNENSKFFTCLMGHDPSEALKFSTPFSHWRDWS